MDTTGWRLPRGQLRALAIIVPATVAIWVVAMTWVPLEISTALIALGILIIPPTSAAVATSRRAADQWSRSRGVAFPAELAQLMHRHLVRTRGARTIGFVTPLAINTLLLAHHNANPEDSRWFVEVWNRSLWGGLWLPALGYVMGSLWAELAKPRPRRNDGEATALLTRRQLTDFVDPGVQKMLIAIALIVGVISIWFFSHDPASKPSPLAPKSGVLVGSLGVVVLALLSAWLVGRRHERASNDADLASEALTRTACINALLGAAIAMLGQFGGELLLSSQFEGAPWRWLRFPVGFFLTLFTLGVWLSCGTSLVFRSKRITMLRAAG